MTRSFGQAFMLLMLLFVLPQVAMTQEKITKRENLKRAGDFPPLIFTDIPGAPKLSKPVLVMGQNNPLKGEGMGWAAPAFYDWDNDGKKDVLIGEFGSLSENRQGGMGHFIRVYTNKGTEEQPAFSDQFYYARTINELSKGTPISVFTHCCMSFIPRFADLDNDGYTDLLSGQFDPGYINWFKGSEKGFLPSEHLEEVVDAMGPYESRDYEKPADDPTGHYYGTYSSAAFGDFDLDGDQDMIIGGHTIRMSENIGTKSSPRFGKREFIVDRNNEKISIHDAKTMVPYVTDWDGDGFPDILITSQHATANSAAVTFLRGRREAGKTFFEQGVPLFYAADGGKSLPGYHPNICVDDWNNDGINDLIIGTSVATLNGKFDPKLSWSWEMETNTYKINPGVYSEEFLNVIKKDIQNAADVKKKMKLSDEELDKINYINETSLRKHYFGKKEYEKTLVHQGYLYLLYGSK